MTARGSHRSARAGLAAECYAEVGKESVRSSAPGSSVSAPFRWHVWREIRAVGTRCPRGAASSGLVRGSSSRRLVVHLACFVTGREGGLYSWAVAELVVRRLPEVDNATNYLFHLGRANVVANAWVVGCCRCAAVAGARRYLQRRPARDTALLRRHLGRVAVAASQVEILRHFSAAAVNDMKVRRLWNRTCRDVCTRIHHPSL